jgi:hypothetical protein
MVLFRPSNGTWYLRYTGTGQASGFPWGSALDIPAPGDFDGDGRTDIAVFRPGDGTWLEPRRGGNFAMETLFCAVGRSRAG